MLSLTISDTMEQDSCRFDSQLESPRGTSRADYYWTLTIRLKVCLNRTDPSTTPALRFRPGTNVSRLQGILGPGSGYITDAENRPERIFHTVPWRESAWNQFRQRFVNECNRFWSDRYYLRVPDTYSDLDWPPGRYLYRPHVKCRFQLTPVVQGQARLTAMCVRIDPETHPEAFRSYVNTLSGQGGFGVAAFTEDDVNVSPRDYASQITAVHELAHALGIHHVGIGAPGCPANNMNAQPCYGAIHQARDGSYYGERQYINGNGMLLSRSQAGPWIRRIARHTGTACDEWTAHLLQYPSAVPPAIDVHSLPTAAYVESVLRP